MYRHSSNHYSFGGKVLTTATYLGNVCGSSTTSPRGLDSFRYHSNSCSILCPQPYLYYLPFSLTGYSPMFCIFNGFPLVRSYWACVASWLSLRLSRVAFPYLSAKSHP